MIDWQRAQTAYQLEERREAERRRQVAALRARRAEQRLETPPPPPPPPPPPGEPKMQPFSRPTTQRQITDARAYAQAMLDYLKRGLSPAEASERAKADVYAQPKTAPPDHGETPDIAGWTKAGFCAPPEPR